MTTLQDSNNKLRAAWEAALKATNAQAIQQYQPEIDAALNSGNYSQAWQDALASNALFANNKADNVYSPAVNSTAGVTQNQIMADMESASGLQSLDPSVTMTPQQIDQYYQAFANATGAGTDKFNANPLGGNSYGSWGNAADNSSGFTNAENANAQAGGLANVGQYLGATQSGGFDDKWLPGIELAVGSAISGGLASAVGGVGGAALGAATTAATNAAQGTSTSLGSLAASAIGSGLTSTVGGAVNDATGIGATASDALAGAGIGATKNALTGGNVLAGAVSGAANGAIQGSGIASTATNALTSEGLPSPLASAITGGVIGAGTGALGAGVTGGNAANGAAIGGANGAITSGINSATGGPSGIGTVGGIIGSDLLSKYLNSSSSSSPAASSSQSQSTGAKVVTPTVGKMVAPTGTTTSAAPTAGATVVSPQPTPTSGTAPTNIGPYTGLGYQPMQQSNYAQTTNWNNYGQGPEQSFFQPVPGT